VNVTTSAAIAAVCAALAAVTILPGCCCFAPPPPVPAPAPDDHVEVFPSDEATIAEVRRYLAEHAGELARAMTPLDGGPSAADCESALIAAALTVTVAILTRGHVGEHYASEAETGPAGCFDRVVVRVVRDGDPFVGTEIHAYVGDAVVAELITLAWAHFHYETDDTRHGSGGSSGWGGLPDDLF
jgi:hypothetical protein